MNVKIEARIHVGIEKDFEDSTFLEAVESFRQEFPEAIVDCINGDEVFEWCEGCGEPIFGHSDYYSDSDGIHWCKAHGK